jgi:hypothetical protein
MMFLLNLITNFLILLPKILPVLNEDPSGFAGGGGENTGDTGQYIWSEFQEGGGAWEWNLKELLSKVGVWIYGAFIILCIVFSGLKLLTAFGNYYSTPNTNAQLKLQYKNDIKEVFTGFLMLTLGAEVLASLISIMFPSSEGVGVVNAINEQISSPDSIFATLSGKFSNLGNAISGVKFVFYMTAGALAFIFVFHIISNLIKYFQSENDSEKVNYKASIFNNLIGLFAVLLAGVIIDKIIQIMFSGTTVITFE